MGMLSMSMPKKPTIAKKVGEAAMRARHCSGEHWQLAQRG